MIKFKQLWNNLRSSLWFLPSLIVASSMALATALIEVDVSVSDKLLAKWPRLFGAGAEGARGMLSTIAASMMSVVGVTFSMTLVALALASSQFSSRILRTFMSSRVTQGVLGIFAGIFTYCLIVLRTIRGGDEVTFIPSVAVLFGVVLAIGGVGVLIFFIHHIASSIQASNIICAVAQETIETIDRLFPERLGHGPAENDDEPAPQLPPGQKWRAISAKESAYIQSVDNEALLRIARENKTVVRMEHGVGQFVIKDTPLVSLAVEGVPDQRVIRALRSAFALSRYRTVHQDAGFGIRQIVDVALKALSPGINDTTTAIICVEYLTAILAPLAVVRIPSNYRHEEGKLRVIAVGPSFEGLLAESFDQIQSSSKGNLTVMLRMLNGLETVAGLTANPRHRRALGEQADQIAELAERTIDATHERATFATRLKITRAAITAALIFPGEETVGTPL
ncbi:MAG: DUF2254 domain-containing protein [Opitutus sp.]